MIQAKIPLLRPAAKTRKAQGFALLEVLVSLVLISIGLLGVAGLNAYAVSNTGVSRTRSLAAMHTASLASAMSANGSDAFGLGGYWATPTSPAENIVLTGNAISGATALAGAGCDYKTYSCAGDGATCTPAVLAACDLQEWGSLLGRELPGGTGRVVCTGAQAASSNTCTITVTWNEKIMTAKSTKDQNNAAAGAALTTQTYQLVVQP